MDPLSISIIDFLPSGIIIATIVANPIIDAVTNNIGFCYENSNSVALNTVLFVLLVLASALTTALSSLGVIVRPRYRYNLEGKVEWIPAMLLGSFIQFFNQMYWILLSNKDPLMCWAKVAKNDYVAYRTWQVLAFMLIGSSLFGVIYLLNRKGIGMPIRGYEEVK
jgi:hypothetical protein